MILLLDNKCHSPTTSLSFHNTTHPHFSATEKFHELALAAIYNLTGCNLASIGTSCLSITHPHSSFTSQAAIVYSSPCIISSTIDTICRFNNQWQSQILKRGFPVCARSAPASGVSGTCPPTSLPPGKFCISDLLRLFLV